MNIPDKLILEDIRIGFRNFAGEAGKFNREGDRFFSIFLNEQQASEFESYGLNVKYLKPHDEEDTPQAHLKVKINYKGFKPPRIFLIAGRKKTELDPTSNLNVLDYAEIERVDLTCRPYQWTIEGKNETTSGVTLYVDSMYVTIKTDPFAERYEDLEEN